jgi:hypothetical protein
MLFFFFFIIFRRYRFTFSFFWLKIIWKVFVILLMLILIIFLQKICKSFIVIHFLLFNWYDSLNYRSKAFQLFQHILLWFDKLLNIFIIFLYSRSSNKFWLISQWYFDTIIFENMRSCYTFQWFETYNYLLKRS